MYWETFEEKKSLFEQQLRVDKHLQMFVSFVFFSVLFYASLFATRIYLAVFKKNNHSLKHSDLIQLVSRIVSSVHAIIATFLSVRVLIYNRDLRDNQLIYSSFETSLIGNIVIGYMVFDFIAMLRYKEIFEWQFVVHHAVSVSAFYASSLYGVFAYIALFRLTSEASTLFVNLRWALLLFKMKDSKYYTWNGMLIIVTFTVFRILPMLPIWYSFFQLLKHPLWPEVHLGFKCLCLGSSIPLDALNAFWYFKIMRMAIKMFLPSSSSSSSSSSLLVDKKD